MWTSFSKTSFLHSSGNPPLYKFIAWRNVIHLKMPPWQKKKRWVHFFALHSRYLQTFPLFISIFIFITRKISTFVYICQLSKTPDTHISVSNYLTHFHIHNLFLTHFHNLLNGTYTCHKSWYFNSILIRNVCNNGDDTNDNL